MSNEEGGPRRQEPEAGPKAGLMKADAALLSEAAVLAMLGERSETVMSATAARSTLGNVLSRAQALRRHHGRETHEIGSAWLSLFAGRADEALGAPSFNELVHQYWPDRTDDVYLFMLIARWYTAEQAEEYGFWKSIYGIRLMRRLGLANTRALETRDFGHDKAGRPIRFRTMRVRQILALGREDAALPAPAAEEDEKVGRAVVRRRERVKRLQADEPAYAKLTVRVRALEGQVAVTVTSTGRDGAATARRFLEELWK